MIIGIPTPNNFFAQWMFVSSLLAVHRDYKAVIINGSVIATNRNQLLKKAKEINEDILMIDSDIVFTPDQVRQIEKDLEQYDVVSGLAMMRNGEPAIFPKEVKQGTFEVDACGGAFLGISKRLYDKLPEDAFNPLPETDNGEDVSFCKRVKDLGHKIYCNSDLKIGHIMVEPIFPHE